MDVEKIKVGRVEVSLLAQDDRIVYSIRDKKPFEPKSLAAWAKMCVPGKTVFDVGGYSGLFAIAAAKLGCNAWSFEPMTENMQRLRANARLNGVSIKTIECVVSDFNGQTEITYNPKVVGMTAGASLIRKKGLKRPVVAMTLDDLHLADVCAIKIDVERGEPAVLRGAKETLRRCRPEMLVESLGDAERALVMESIDGYEVADVFDVRNLHMTPL